MKALSVRASAPGKVILMGEHAAVYGCPVLVAALGRRVEATLCSRGRRVVLDLESIGHRTESTWHEILAYREAKQRAWTGFAGRSDGEGFAKVVGSDPAHVVKIALGEVAHDVGLRQPPPISLRVVSQIPVGSGFGSSAAVAVAVVGACLKLLCGEAPADRVARLAMEVERRQHGHPSGADHSAVLGGGVVRLVRGGSPRPVGIADWVRRDFVVYHTGVPAETTGDVVAAVRRLRHAAEGAFDRRLQAMATAVGSFETLLRKPEVDEAEVCEVIGDFQRRLEEIGVVPRAVAEAVRSLEGLGGGGKISGAGALTGSHAGCLLVYRPPGIAAAVDELLSGYSLVTGEIGVSGLSLEEIA